MALGLVPTIFNAVNVIALLHKRLGVIDTHMMKTRDIPCLVTGQRSGVDNAVGHNHLIEYRQQGRCLGIGNGCGIGLPPRFRIPKTGTFPAAPRPRFPFRRPPK